MNAEKVADVLFRAADRVQFQGWTQGTYARDAGGVPVRAGHPDAAQWCVRGALKVDAPSPYWLHKTLYTFAGYLIAASGPRVDSVNVMAWNDDRERTAGEVADAMRRCAKGLLEAAQQ